MSSMPLSSAGTTNASPQSEPPSTGSEALAKPLPALAHSSEFQIPQQQHHPNNSNNPSTFAQNAPMPQSNISVGNNFTLPNFSASTQEILKRVSESKDYSSGSPEWEAARRQVLQHMASNNTMTGTTFPSAQRGRGVVGTAAQTGSVSDGTPLATTPFSPDTPGSSGRGRGRGGRPRGRARAAGRGRGKRKRDDSDASEVGSEPSDASATYTPLPTVTKSGRNVNKPSQFNPAPDSAENGTKRRRSYRRGIELTLCSKCQRGHSPLNNMIVFCDICNTPYHQWCHDPQIPKDVVEIAEKEWICGKCMHVRETEDLKMEDRVSGQELTADEKSQYLLGLSSETLVSLLLHVTQLYPDLPIFAPGTRDLLRARPPARDINMKSVNDDIHHETTNPSQPTTAVHTSAAINHAPASGNEDDSYHDYNNPQNDPPATYPRPGHGPIQVRPTTDTEDVPYLVDNNFGVFSHLYNDGSGNLVPVHGAVHPQAQHSQNPHQTQPDRNGGDRRSSTPYSQNSQQQRHTPQPQPPRWPPPQYLQPPQFQHNLMFNPAAPSHVQQTPQQYYQNAPFQQNPQLRQYQQNVQMQQNQQHVQQNAQYPAPQQYQQSAQLQQGRPAFPQSHSPHPQFQQSLARSPQASTAPPPGTGQDNVRYAQQ